GRETNVENCISCNFVADRLREQTGRTRSGRGYQDSTNRIPFAKYGRGNEEGQGQTLDRHEYSLTARSDVDGCRPDRPDRSHAGAIFWKPALHLKRPCREIPALGPCCGSWQ